MKSALGWTLLSKKALEQAESQLRDDIEGVRDEIGFLSLHQAYADRFFPGTSVLHTRLRYALFVPWLYQRLLECGEGRRIDSLLEREEVFLAGRLKKSNEDGIIGQRTYPKPSVQPPSLVYWTALGTWRILRALPSGDYPSRAAVHRVIAQKIANSRIRDDDQEPLEESEQLFAAMPSPPLNWNNPNVPLDFVLLPEEAKFIRNMLLAVHRSGEAESPSLLARLIEVPITAGTTLYCQKIQRAADSRDCEALMRAEQVAALSAIGRGIYAALVEELRDSKDHNPTANIHRLNLRSIVQQFSELATALEIDAIHKDAEGIGNSILEILRSTQGWLLQRKADPSDLYELYRDAELHRKGRRSRLPLTIGGRDKRAEWTPEGHPLAQPLHFRWGNVRRLLIDLQSAA